MARRQEVDSELSARALDCRSVALLNAAIAGDLVLRTALASALSAALLRGTLSEEGREDDNRLAFYAELAEARNAESVFAQPPQRVRISTTRHRDDLDGRRQIDVVRFRSPYRALHPALRREYARPDNRNRLIAAHHWRHSDGPRPTLCVIHGFGASPVWFNAAFFSLEAFFLDGWDVLLYTLPFHGGRGGRAIPDGIGMFGAGAARIHEAIVQAVFDFRILLAYLERYGSPRVGVTGLSLGGYVSALLAAVEKRLDFVIPNAPVTWMPALIDSWLPANAVVSAGRRVLGISEDLLTHSFALHSPLTYPPVVAKQRLMIVRGLGDKLAPPEQAELLWEHWGRPHMHSFAGSHVLHFGRSAYLAEMRKVMGRAGVRADR